MRVHLDTDLGGDPDDACALAMLLGWPDVEVTGITTTADADGLRGGYVRYLLALAGRAEVPLVTGAAESLTSRERADPFVDDRFWPADIEPVTSPPGAAMDLISGVARGATVIATGPQTNLALLELARPGSLADVRVVVMGGWVRPLGDDLPGWGPDRDWNVAWDIDAAEIVAAAATDLTLVPMAATVRTHVRAADLPRLRTAGAVGRLLARQAVAYAADRDHAALGRAHAGLPDDLLHFLHDPLACAVALGWPGARTEVQRLRPTRSGGGLTFAPDPGGRLVTVVTDVDGAAFGRRWLDAVDAVDHAGSVPQNGPVSPTERK